MEPIIKVPQFLDINKVKAAHICIIFKVILYLVQYIIYNIIWYHFHLNFEV